MDLDLGLELWPLQSLGSLSFWFQPSTPDPRPIRPARGFPVNMQGSYPVQNALSPPGENALVRAEGADDMVTCGMQSREVGWGSGPSRRARSIELGPAAWG